MTPSVVLYVEDDRVIRQNYVELLSGENFRVNAFADQNSALAAVASALPDVALLDVALGTGGREGLVVAQALRDRSPTVPILFFSSRDRQEERTACIAAGGDDFLPKETPTDRVIEAIRQAAKRYRRFLQRQAEGAYRSIDDADFRLTTEPFAAAWRDHRLLTSLTDWLLIRHAVTHAPSVSTASLIEASLLYLSPWAANAHMEQIRQRWRAADERFNAL